MIFGILFSIFVLYIAKLKEKTILDPEYFEDIGFVFDSRLDDGTKIYRKNGAVLRIRCERKENE